MKKEYLEDLEYFLKQAEAKRKNLDEKYPNEPLSLNFYFKYSKDEIYKYIEEYINNHEINDKYDFLYFMKTLIKYICGEYDSHTSIFSNDNYLLPLNFRFVEGNIFINDCLDEKFKKSKLLSINGINISKIIEEIETIIPYGTNSYLLSEIERALRSKNKLLSLPSIKSDLTYVEFETDKGKLKISLEKEETLLEPKYEFYKIVDNMLIFKYPSCEKKYAPNIEYITKLIKENNIQKFVLDLTFNGGGDSNIIKPLIEFLKESNLKLYTIVDKRVISSSASAAIIMKSIGSKIIGEDIGTPTNRFGDVIFGGTMPNTKYKFRFSRRYWYFNEELKKISGYATIDKLNKQTKDFFVLKFLEIDKYIEITEDEFKKYGYENAFLMNCLDYIKVSEKTK